MYDIVNEVFHTNQGTGTFLKGPDVKRYVVPINVKGKNLFNKKAVTNGKYINSDGTLGDYYAYSISEYIEVLPNNNYSYHGLSAYSYNGAFYDKDKNFISSFNEKFKLI